jgi:hypothetical protein
MLYIAVPSSRYKAEASRLSMGASSIALSYGLPFAVSDGYLHSAKINILNTQAYTFHQFKPAAVQQAGQGFRHEKMWPFLHPGPIIIDENFSACFPQSPKVFLNLFLLNRGGGKVENGLRDARIEANKPGSRNTQSWRNSNPFGYLSEAVCGK